jgi:integrase
MKKKLTSAALLNNSLAEGEYWDLTHPGLHLRVGANRKTWLYRYRAGGKQKRERLGYYLGNDTGNGMGLAEARDAAGAIDKRIDAGLPAAVVELVVHPRSPDALTLGTLFDRYEKMREKEGHRTKRLRRSMMTLRHCLKDYLDVLAREFSKADLRAARDKVAENAPAQANALLRNLSPVFMWAAQEDIVPNNFVGNLRKSPGRKRKRILDADELRAVWNACEKFGGQRAAKSYARMVRFLMVTGCRLGEAAAMKHGDVLGGFWKQADNKSDRPHRLKLPRLALDQISKGSAPDLCFPGQRSEISGFSKLKKELDEACCVKSWTIHDLRRTFISGLGDLGIDQMTIKAVVNHAIATGALSHYMLAELEKQKTAALEAWAAELQSIVRDRVLSKT